MLPLILSPKPAVELRFLFPHIWLWVSRFRCVFSTAPNPRIWLLSLWVFRPIRCPYCLFGWCFLESYHSWFFPLWIFLSSYLILYFYFDGFLPQAISHLLLTGKMAMTPYPFYSYPAGLLTISRLSPSDPLGTHWRYGYESCQYSIGLVPDMTFYFGLATAHRVSHVFGQSALPFLYQQVFTTSLWFYVLGCTSFCSLILREAQVAIQILNLLLIQEGGYRLKLQSPVYPATNLGLTQAFSAHQGNQPWFSYAVTLFPLSLLNFRLTYHFG